MSSAGIARLPQPVAASAELDVLDARIRAANPPCRSGQYDPDLWFPDAENCATQKVFNAEAFALCKACPVMWLCRSLAVRRGEEYGIWGATTPCDRLALRSRREGWATSPHVRECATGRRKSAAPAALPEVA